MYLLTYKENVAYTRHMKKNGIRYKGQILHILPFVDRPAHITRLYSDATCVTPLDNPKQETATIGSGYCVKFSGPTSHIGKPAIPAHGFMGDKWAYGRDMATIELMGVVFALQETGLTENLEIICDSCNSIRVLNLVLQHGAKAKDFSCNLQLRDVIRQLEVYSDQGITARWVRGHAKDPHNKFADRLATLGRKIYESEKNYQYTSLYQQIQETYQREEQAIIN